MSVTTAPLPSDFPPIKTLDVQHHNLPAQMTSFIGRTAELLEVKQALSTHRLVTLTGSGGAGKTRLSLQVGAECLNQFSNGVWFVELAPVADPTLIPQTLLAIFGLREDSQRTALEILIDYLLRANPVPPYQGFPNSRNFCASFVRSVSLTSERLTCRTADSSDPSRPTPYNADPL